MTDTTNLALPCIEGSQAQKQVTHNDALRILDTLVQLAVADRDLTAPPGSPAEGERWIVKATGTGAWAGHDNAIVAWQDGVWQFNTPQIGWSVFVADEGTFAIWNGTAWNDFFSVVTAIQNVALLGVGTTADATNPLAAKLNNTLFVAKTVAEGGDGTLRYKLSKESAAKTLSFLFQDNYSGRAEIGLTGDDDFHFKVSPDGSTWTEGIRIAAATGKVSFPASGGPREMLTANRTYYVRTDGNNANNGLSDASDGAFLTWAKAFAVIQTLDFAGLTVTIKHGSETGKTFTEQLSIPVWVGGGALIISGNGASNTFLNAPNQTIFVNSGSLPGGVTLTNVKLGSSGNTAIQVNYPGLVSLGSGVEFGSAASMHMYAAIAGAKILAATSYTISGNAQRHAWAASGGLVQLQSSTVTLTGSPVFSTAFAHAQGGSSIVIYSEAFSGSTGSTSKRYVADTNGIINTFGQPTTYLPGDTAGTTATGGQYV